LCRGDNLCVLSFCALVYDCVSRALYEDPEATLDDLREAVATLEETMRIARRVLGGAHPLIVEVEKAVRYARECSTAANLTQSSASA